MAAVLGIASLALLPWTRFDRNQLNLREAGTEGMVAYQDLIRDGTRSPLTISVVVEGQGEAEALAAKLEALDTVRQVVGLHDFVPERQDEKLDRLDELVLILGPLDPVESRPVSKAKTMAELRRLAPRLAAYSSSATDPPDRMAATRLEAALGALLERLETDRSTASPLLERLSESVLGTFAPVLSTIRQALQADEFSVEALPPNLVRRWVASADRYRLEVFPAQDVSEAANMRRFVSQVLSAAPSATDAPVIELKSGDVVVRAFQQSFACALVLIGVLLWLALRRLSDVLLVLGPLTWAGLVTAASMVTFGVPFNYANVVALPLLLGAGVDSAIHVVARLRGHMPSSGRIMATSTGRAVLVSALSTLCSFGNLALSPHRGTASMGQVLTLGLLWILVATLLLLPAVVARRRRETT